MRVAEKNHGCLAIASLLSIVTAFGKKHILSKIASGLPIVAVINKELKRRLRARYFSIESGATNITHLTQTYKKRNTPRPTHPVDQLNPSTDHTHQPTDTPCTPKQPDMSSTITLITQYYRSPNQSDLPTNQFLDTIGFSILSIGRYLNILIGLFSNIIGSANHDDLLTDPSTNTSISQYFARGKRAKRVPRASVVRKRK